MPNIVCTICQVVNPLGAKRGKHKVTAFYFLIGNIGSKYNASLRNIHLLAIARDRLVKKYSYSRILEPLIKDFQQLYDSGIQVQFEGHLQTLHGVLATVSADNLSAHLLAGFSAGFGSGRICRQCLALYCEINHKFEEKDFIVRSSDIHKYHLSAIKDNNPSGALVYGVDHKCPLETLEYFDTTNAFPPDLMHDFLEGVVPKLLKLMLREFHKESLITISAYNKELQKFKFGTNDSSSRPVELSNTVLQEGKGPIPGSAAQKLCMFLLLPLIIGHLVPTRNPLWALYLLCREISDIILAPNIKTCWLSVLEYKTTNFLKLFQDIFPGKQTPKFHYLVHYARLIQANGPLRPLWCMRFEAKHQYFKKLAAKLHNFKNIAKSFASRHQMKQCWELSSVDILKQEPSSVGGNPVQYGKLTRDLQNAIQTSIIGSSYIDENETVWQLTSCTHDHVQYRAGNILVLDIVHSEDIPVFLKITHCIKIRDLTLLSGRIHFAQRFLEHYHAYVVQDSGDTIAICPGQEQDHQSLDMYTTNEGLQMVVLRYHPC